ncbi:hypothetical protein ACSFE6_13155 [Pseudomonas baetica]|uniref:hypothetical protein n=1 Tax=Pseudomonas baetica TaxID=674054 RepID=UPI003EE92851
MKLHEALDDARAKLADIYSQLELAKSLLQQSEKLDNPEFMQARAVQMLQKAADDAQVFALNFCNKTV